MVVGQWYYMVGKGPTSDEIWFLAVEPQKNGGMRGVEVVHQAATRRKPKAKQASVRAAYFFQWESRTPPTNIVEALER